MPLTTSYGSPPFPTVVPPVGCFTSGKSCSGSWGLLSLYATLLRFCIPNVHGEDRLHVPKTAFAMDDPTTVLAEGFSGGARWLLLVGDTGLARAMFAQDLTDQLFLDNTSPRVRRRPRRGPHRPPIGYRPTNHQRQYGRRRDNHRGTSVRTGLARSRE